MFSYKFFTFKYLLKKVNINVIPLYDSTPQSFNSDSVTKTMCVLYPEFVMALSLPVRLNWTILSESDLLSYSKKKLLLSYRIENTYDFVTGRNGPGVC